MDQVKKIKDVDNILKHQAFDLDLEEFEGKQKQSSYFLYEFF